MSLKEKISDYYEKNETKVDIAFFLGGFVFDVLTLSDIDDPLSILQQVVYLVVIGAILYYDFLNSMGLVKVSNKMEKSWNYRHLVMHFLLGSLLSVYSLFFLKSASLFSSVVFVLLIMGIMVANELKSVQKSGANVKIALYVICVFSFFSMIVPTLLGFVGLIPFLLSMLCTALVVYGSYRLLQKKVQDEKALSRSLLVPSGVVLVLFLVFYIVGWIPPVPLSVQNMGVYHAVEKMDGKYVVSHEKPWWKFWSKGDQDFMAEPGDKIYFFAQIFSPGRFSDSVILHWYYKEPRSGWMSTDKIPMHVTGGRANGYRGFATKQNYADGEYRISVETTDGREIGRLYFEVKKVATNTPNRVFEKESF